MKSATRDFFLYELIMNSPEYANTLNIDQIVYSFRMEKVNFILCIARIGGTKGTTINVQFKLT